MTKSVYPFKKTQTLNFNENTKLKPQPSMLCHNIIRYYIWQRRTGITKTKTKTKTKQNKTKSMFCS